jgi:hypothetical protein
MVGAAWASWLRSANVLVCYCAWLHAGFAGRRRFCCLRTGIYALCFRDGGSILCSSLLRHGCFCGVCYSSSNTFSPGRGWRERASPSTCRLCLHLYMCSFLPFLTCCCQTASCTSERSPLSDCMRSICAAIAVHLRLFRLDVTCWPGREDALFSLVTLKNRA